MNICPISECRAGNNFRMHIICFNNCLIKIEIYAVYYYETSLHLSSDNMGRKRLLNFPMAVSKGRFSA